MTMKQQAIALCALMLFSANTQAQEKDGGITAVMMKQMRESYKPCGGQRALSMPWPPTILMPWHETTPTRANLIPISV